jgi:hypothetical protein
MRARATPPIARAGGRGKTEQASGVPGCGKARRTSARCVLGALALCLSGLLAVPVGCQSFGPPLLGEVLYQLQDREGTTRFTLATYAAQWQNPFSFHVTVFSPALADLGEYPVVTRRFRRLLIADTPSSPLVEATYSLGKRWSLGLWYNPIRGERLRKTVQVAEFRIKLDLERNTDLADLHLVYYGSRGLSAQVGYFREQGTFRDKVPTTVPRTEYTLGSWNLWLTQRLDVRAGCRMLTPFVSAGYHPSAQLNHAVSILVGTGITFGERLSLSGSAWWFDLSDPAVRITAGLAYRL